MICLKAGFTLVVVLASACFDLRVASVSVLLQPAEANNSQSRVSEMARNATDASPPHFLLDLYECLTSTGQARCLESLQGMNHQDFTVSGAVGQVLDFQPNSFTVSFANLVPSNSLHAVEVHLFKGALSVDEFINILNSSCDLTNGIDVEFSIETTVNSSSKRYGHAYNRTLMMNDLVMSQWIVLAGLESIYTEWINSEKHELLLRVTVHKECAPLSHKLRNVSDGWEPLLVRVLVSQSDSMNFFRLDVHSKKRSKRSQQFEELDNKDEEPSNLPSARCKLFAQNISFKDITEYMVLAPPYYTANFCSGHCRHPIPGSQGNFHAQAQAALHERNSTRISAPCCAPVEYSHIQVIAQNATSGMYEVHVHNEASALKCGCR